MLTRNTGFKPMACAFIALTASPSMRPKAQHKGHERVPLVLFLKIASYVELTGIIAGAILPHWQCQILQASLQKPASFAWAQQTWAAQRQRQAQAGQQHKAQKHGRVSVCSGVQHTCVAAATSFNI